jgi:serine acetyltransferase
LRHGVGLVVNPYSVLGENVMLRQGVTIGNRRGDFDCPTIGRDVEIGAGATLIGAITIGDGAKVGAGAVVLGDVPPGGVAVATPATVRPPRPIP